MIWRHVTKQNPCPICQKPDWCQFGDRAVKCMRVESAKPCPSGGWYHFYDNSIIAGEFSPVFKKTAPVRINAGAILSRLRVKSSPAHLERPARLLGVTTAALESLGATWHLEKNALAFPMFDEHRNEIGIRLRNERGFKWAVTGSRNGLFIPKEINPQLVTLLPEGPTNTAALLSIGIQAIGRPNVSAGNDTLSKCLKFFKIKRAVVVADNDELKQLGNREGRPGIEGAIKLQKELKVPTVIWMPPSPLKDARDFVNRGGTAAQIQSDISGKVWTI